MKKIFLLFSVAAALIFTSCNSDSRPTVLNNVVCILNQGNYSQHNGSIYLYDETTMPVELRRAHQQNDKAVMQAYGFSIKMTESECVAALMKMYQELTKDK